MGYKNKEDQNRASRQHYIKNKQRYLDRNKKYRRSINDFVKDLKEKKPCEDCNKNFPYYVMDFDHVGEKTENINFLAKTGRIGALKKELLKCELVCSNCHRERTFSRSGLQI